MIVHVIITAFPNAGTETLSLKGIVRIDPILTE